ncbi:MAG: fibrobacter succinogenes major paralogous domain-containing protein [Chitinophagales bacterium]|uniref:Fibrobacter succinogenes major paralogous domain-containing protein n=1 Tax=Candidatus Opimibacter skivensis TaxID=2982028 RepID=A0A9D7XLC3_9BACT|nr:fibrobacter succinogenes major paralogous domain-containing protein [Candidatus Opimibacter skivensis]
MKKLLAILIFLSFTLAGLAQNVGIGTTAPSAKLDVNGTFKVADGTQGAGKILTSDATGLASWQPPPPPPGTNDPSVSICCQRWMTKNLDVATYRNGDAIPKVTDDAAWAALTTGAYCYYLNDSTTYAAIYGKLYNWYAVNDSRALAPEGWYIPTDFEWTTLGSCLGGNNGAGGPMKEMGTTHWTTPNTGATNLIGFTGLPGGYRFANGAFTLLVGDSGNWWSSTEANTDDAWFRYLFYSTDNLSRNLNNKRLGYSVRCLRD